MAGLLLVSRQQLCGCNLFSFLDGVLGDPDSSEWSNRDWLPSRAVTISRREAPSVPVQLAIFDHQEKKLWLFSSAVFAPDHRLTSVEGR